MYTLIMVLLIWSGDSSTGGPLVVDGFRTEEACLAYAEKIKRSVPTKIVRKHGFIDYDNKVSWEHVDCIEKKIN